MNFIDRTMIKTRSGDGGDGNVSFMCAKGRPKLGPDGGDGGRGGDLFIVGKKGLNTLSSLRYKQMYKAEDGQKGGVQERTGKGGASRYIEVPLGTIATNDESGEYYGEVMEDGQKLMISPGGKKGLGNIRFVKATHQVPRESKPGGKGITVDLRLELKLLADVGLAGFPNAGKSTLLSRISAARPKIAEYPFTTLVPNLGVVDADTGEYGESIVVADVPGLIEGASNGKGLGHEFLRHLERTSLVAYVIEAPDWERNPLDAFNNLKTELEAYSEMLAKRHYVVLLTKTDLVSDTDQLDELKTKFSDMGIEVMSLSSVTGDGVLSVKRRLAQLVKVEKARIEKEELEAEFESTDTVTNEHLANDAEQSTNA